MLLSMEGRAIRALEAACIPALVTLAMFGCNSHSDPPPTPPDHSCTTSFTTRWAQKSLELRHVDPRTCPFNIPVGGTFETAFIIYDWAADFPSYEAGDADMAFLDVIDESGGTLFGSQTSFFTFDFAPGPCCEWVSKAEFSPSWVRGESPDFALFDVRFLHESGTAHANVRLDYYVGNDM